jgi:ADP-ribose pyrophosphatase
MNTIYKGRVFSVETGRRRFPNGTEHEVAIVRHAPSVVLIPIDGDGRVIIVRQYRAPLDREIWVSAGHG